jgi:Tfp pilus assembly protein FimV
MDARTEEPCPVCGEPLHGRPDHCFRCETSLAPWWAFEDALSGMAPPLPRGPNGRRRRAVAAGAALMVMAAGIAAVVLATRRPPAPVALAPSGAIAPSAPAPDDPPAAAPALLSYRVQRGDSLWRIAASLTGDGRRWRELWPQHAGGAAPLAPGTVLEVDLRRLRAAP